jgi:acetoin utilization deacetylase AcuC-like enzyme
MIEVAFSDKYIYTLPEGHRFPIGKYKLIVDKLLNDNIIGANQLFDPGMIGNEVMLAHNVEYYNNVTQFALTASEIRTLGVPLHEASVNRALNSVAGTIRSAEKAKKKGLGISIGGGYHHAFSDHGEGFCIFNDLAIAARYLVYNNLANKILIVDLDVHQGNGTASILSDDDDIYTFSMHGSKNYPAKKVPSNYDLELPDGMNDKDYLYNLEHALDFILKQFNPDYILYQAGVDVLQSDQLGRLGLSMEGCRKRDEIVFKTIGELNIQSALTLGGGYSRDISVIIQAHVNTIITALSLLE